MFRIFLGAGRLMGIKGNGALTLQEQRTHFAMWVALKSPILLGTDVRLQ
jgi:hypothetical protein